MPQISMLASSAGTKGLLDGTTALQKEGTTLQVYDYLSEFNGTINGKGAGYYIDNTLTFKGSTDGSSSDGKWQFPDNRKYYWTKTGTHKFFGWLTQDGNDTANLTAAKLFGTEPKIADDMTLTLGPVTFTKDTPQFDFSFSEIVTRDAAIATDRTAVPMNLQHIFTALSVKVSNQTGAPVTELAVSFDTFHNGRTIKIDYSGSAADTTYTGGSHTVYAYGTLPSMESPETETFVPVYATDPYRLLWPQENLSVSKVRISYKIDERIPDDTAEDGYIINTVTNTISADLKGIFKTTVTDPATGTETTLEDCMKAGYKYLLKITVKLSELRFDVVVDPLNNINKTGDELFYFES